jgi:streptomycin 6-kinase
VAALSYRIVEGDLILAGEPFTIPDAFARHSVEAFGDAGREWLRTLPALVADLARRWGVTLGAPFALSYNYVAPARLADGTEAVFKAGVPSAESRRELYALRRYNGDGICRLLAADDERCAMLLERLRPGETLAPLASINDEGATRIAARVMAQLWRPVPAGPPFLPVAQWFADAFDRHRREYGGAGPFPVSVFQRAVALVPELLNSAPREVLLHGDLHHYNILTAERAPWLAIDPKGVTGDPGYDVGQFFLNPDLGNVLAMPEVVRRRLDVFAEELRYDRARLAAWAFAEVVLSACWSAEDHGDGWQDAIAVAETLLGL